MREFSDTTTLLEPFVNQSSADQPVIVLIQDGIGIERGVRAAYPEAIICSAIAWIGANLLSDGIVEHGLLERLELGVFTVERRQTLDERTKRSESTQGKVAEARLASLAEMFKLGGSDVDVKEEIQVARWQKNMW